MSSGHPTPYRTPAPTVPAAKPTPEYETLLWGLASILLGPVAFAIGLKVSARLLDQSFEGGRLWSLRGAGLFAIVAFAPTLRSALRKRAATFEPQWSVAVGLLVGGAVTFGIAALAWLIASFPIGGVHG